jgi:hypothetical protein
MDDILIQACLILILKMPFIVIMKLSSFQGERVRAFTFFILDR